MAYMNPDSRDVISRALARFRDDTRDERIPRELPLLEELCERGMQTGSFDELDVMFVQHHLGPFIPRLRRMNECGMDFSRCWFVDIPYSTHRGVIEELDGLGCPSAQRVQAFDDPIAPYSRRQLERVEYVVRGYASQQVDRRLLVLDDGAYFLRALRSLLPREKGLVERFGRGRTCLVEQTTRGHRYLEEHESQDMLRDLQIPAVSIARTNTKYDLESPFIGAGVARAVREALQGNARRSQGLGRVLMIGFGAVGKATAKEIIGLPHDGAVDVYDLAYDELEEEIQRIGANPIDRFPEHGRYDTVVGCTGYASFPVNRTEILADDALLISGSSAAVEFNREQFIDLAYERDDDDFFVLEPERTRNSGIHATISLKRHGRRFSFQNAGFPVNFDGRVEHLPAMVIQITHALLYAACQEVRGQTPGFHVLSDESDAWLTDRGLFWIERYGTGASCT